jgi:hypothetical protein
MWRFKDIFYETINSQMILNESLAEISNRLYHNKKFMDWFGASQVKTLDGKPLVMFHGTPADFEQFSSDYADIGNMQYGIGHYFTSDPGVASSYSSKTGNHQSGANVRPVVLKIEYPLDAEEEFKLQRNKMIKLIKSSPNLSETLENWGDVKWEGYNKVFNYALRGAIPDDNIYTVNQLTTIGTDFYGRNSKMFLDNLKKIFGIDGVRVNDEIWVAYFPNQILNLYRALTM